MERPPPVADRADLLHDESLVIDGMTFRFGGWSDDALAGGVDVVNSTIDDFVSGYDVTLDRFRRALRLVEEDERFVLVSDSGGFDQARTEGKVGVVFAFQNTNPIDQHLANLETFVGLGLRCLQLTYNEENAVGAGCLADEDTGLTPFGRDVVRLCNQLGVAIDLSHCSERTSLEAIEASEYPCSITHAGAAAITPSPRNKTDELLRAVADAGGVIGISLYGPFCWNSQSGRRPGITDVMRHFRHVIELVGPDHIALGSDWPMGVDHSAIRQAAGQMAARYDLLVGRYNELVGQEPAVRYPSRLETMARLPNLTRALVGEGIADDVVRGFLGENLRRWFEGAWQV